MQSSTRVHEGASRNLDLRLTRFGEKRWRAAPKRVEGGPFSTPSSTLTYDKPVDPRECRYCGKLIKFAKFRSVRRQVSQNYRRLFAAILRDPGEV